MKTVLITGANRGIGLEFTKQLAAQGNQILATCREPSQAAALQSLAKTFKTITIFKLDITKDESIDNLIDSLNNEPIDWLINNAGITGVRGIQLGTIDRRNFLNVMNVNCLSTLRISEALLPNLHLGSEKLVLCISSGTGSITESQGGRYAYRASKAALNCVMRSYAIDTEADGIRVLILHPGWVQTDLGGDRAEVDVTTSVTGMLQVVEANKSRSNAEAMLSYDGSFIAW